MSLMAPFSNVIGEEFRVKGQRVPSVQWELEVSTYERETTKIAVFINGTSGPLQEWIQLLFDCRVQQARRKAPSLDRTATTPRSYHVAQHI